MRSCGAVLGQRYWGQLFMQCRRCTQCLALIATSEEVFRVHLSGLTGAIRGGDQFGTWSSRPRETERDLDERLLPSARTTGHDRMDGPQPPPSSPMLGSASVEPYAFVDGFVHT